MMQTEEVEEGEEEEKEEDLFAADSVFARGHRRNACHSSSHF